MPIRCGSVVLLRSLPELTQLATIQFIGYLAHEVVEVWALYSFYRYDWTASDVGFSLALVGVMSIIVSGGLVRVIVPRIGERRALYTGQCLGAIGMLLAGLARSGALFLASIPVLSLWQISGPAAQGMMTRRVSEREQGELQGAISSLRSIAVLIGAAVFTFTFAFFIDPKNPWHVPGAPWFLASALLFTAMMLSTRVKRRPTGEPTEPAAAATPNPVVTESAPDVRSFTD